MTTGYRFSKRPLLHLHTLPLVAVFRLFEREESLFGIHTTSSIDESDTLRKSIHIKPQLFLDLIVSFVCCSSLL